MNYILIALIALSSLVSGYLVHEQSTPNVGASQSISSLTELTSLSHNDVLPITEANGLTTKKVKWGTATSSMKAVFDPLYSPIFSTSAGLAGLLSDETGSSGGFVRAGSPSLTTPTMTSPVITLGSDATGDVYYRNGSGVFSRLPLGSNGQLLTASSTGLPEWRDFSATFDSLSVTGIATFNSTSTFNATSTFSGITIGASDEIYGNGIDGDVVISANATNTTDKYYNNLTINSGIHLDTGGYKIFVKGTFTNNGTLSHNGGSASGATIGSGATSGTLRGGADGGAASAGTNGARGGAGGAGGGVLVLSAKNIINNGVISANGGKGGNGNGDGDAGGSSGSGSAGASIDNGRGGAGGASGTTANTSAASAGTVTVSKQYLAIPSVAFSGGYDPILNKVLGGGAGGGGGGEGMGTGEAGGGGGGGGVVVIFYSTATFGTETATGGVGGTKTGNGTNGANGSDGLVLKVQI